MSIDHVSTV
jgi:hypothetical protein